MLAAMLVLVKCAEHDDTVDEMLFYLNYNK